MLTLSTFYSQIIHAIIDFNGNHIKKYEWIQKKSEFIMDFWNDDIIFGPCIQNKKMWTLETVKGESFNHVFISNKIVITCKYK
jgi:hypothetical protein